MDPKVELLTQNLTQSRPILGVIYGNFVGRKSRFLVFSKIVLEFFRKCLGIVFDLKRPTFIVFATRN